MPTDQPEMTLHIFSSPSIYSMKHYTCCPPPVPPSIIVSSALNGWLLHTFTRVKLKVVQHKPPIWPYHPYSSQICYVKMDPITANISDRIQNSPSTHHKHSNHRRCGRWGAARHWNTRLGPLPSSSRQLENFALIVGDVLVRAQSVGFDQNAAGY
jgi:hypothetical protein